MADRAEARRLHREQVRSLASRLPGNRNQRRQAARDQLAQQRRQQATAASARRAVGE